MSLGKKFESDPTAFTVVDGKLYLNNDESIGKLFKKDTEEHIEQADAQWEKISVAVKDKKMKK